MNPSFAGSGPKKARFNSLFFTASIKNDRILGVDGMLHLDIPF